MQGRERSGGMSKSKTGLWSLGQGSQIRVWNGEVWAGSSTWSSKNRTKVYGWRGYTVGDLRTSSGYGEVWIGVPVQCYTECNTLSLCFLSTIALFLYIVSLVVWRNVYNDSVHPLVKQRKMYSSKFSSVQSSQAQYQWYKPRWLYLSINREKEEFLSSFSYR